MQVTPSLQLKQSQNLVMTQQLQQSIKLLQLGALELREFVEQELEKNPLLAEDEGEAPAEENKEESSTDTATDTDTSSDTETSDEWESSEKDADGSWDYKPAERTPITVRDSNGDEAEMEDSRAKEVTLREHLLEQLGVEIAEGVQRKIGAHLIDLTDEAGYIKEDLSAIATQLGAQVKEIETVLSTLQRFEPVGVCARNLAECLTLQLQELDRLDPAMQALLDNLELLAEGNLTALQRKCGVDLEDIKDMIAELRRLNPKPGLSYLQEVIQHVEPDVVVKRDAKGKFLVELNTSVLPRVLVNRRYYSEVTTSKLGAADKKYLSEQWNNANWLVKALDQRATTILKVATEIVAQQQAFFQMGIHHLKPLTLKDIALATGYHESTVSRVTTGKYVMSPRGLFELKYFFTSGVGHGAGGDDVSSETVKHVIKELIDRETANAILSDDDLAARLKEQNIDVARRTVAKYREAMRIPSSVDRRRQKRLAAG